LNSENIILCPCGTGKYYQDCCKPYHDGTLCKTALLLMRSRYSAYALSLSEYIIKTTHPENSGYSSDANKWKKEILSFCAMTSFNQLEIMNFTDGKENARVTFVAHLQQKNDDASFMERSLFKKEEDQWLYADGQILNPQKFNH